MSPQHRVAPGEHIPGIATRYGFADYGVVWNHDENAALREQRDNPNVLAAGDQVFIPDPVPRTVDRPTGQRHSFTLKGAPLVLRLALEAAYWGPIAQAQCSVTAGADAQDIASGDDGIVERPLPALAKEGNVSVQSDSPTSLTFDLALEVGFLDPVDQRSGQLARLANLGYYRAAPDPVDKAEWTSAVEEFQCEHGLGVDGECGVTTQAKLVEIHGC